VPSTLLLGDVPLTFVEHPLYSEAHPNEPCDPEQRCEKCARVIRPDTGETLLLWQAGEKDWTVSRNDPHWQRHRDELFSMGTPR
jgi:hypothetical protein